MSRAVLIGRGSYLLIVMNFLIKAVKVFGVKERVAGDQREVDTPGHMPNPAVKHFVADGTAEGIRGRVGSCQ